MSLLQQKYNIRTRHKPLPVTLMSIIDGKIDSSYIKSADRLLLNQELFEAFVRELYWGYASSTGQVMEATDYVMQIKQEKEPLSFTPYILNLLQILQAFCREAEIRELICKNICSPTLLNVFDKIIESSDRRYIDCAQFTDLYTQKLCSTMLSSLYFIYGQYISRFDKTTIRGKTDIVVGSLYAKVDYTSSEMVFMSEHSYRYLKFPPVKERNVVYRCPLPSNYKQIVTELYIFKAIGTRKFAELTTNFKNTIPDTSDCLERLYHRVWGYFAAEIDGV